MHRKAIDVEVALASAVRRKHEAELGLASHDLRQIVPGEKPKKKFLRKVRDELRRAKRKLKGYWSSFRIFRAPLRRANLEAGNDINRTGEPTPVQLSSMDQRLTALQETAAVISSEMTSVTQPLKYMTNDFKRESGELLSAAQQLSSMAKQLESLEDRMCSEIMSRLQRIEESLHNISIYSLISARRVAIPGDEGEVMIRSEAGYVIVPSCEHAVMAHLIETGDLEVGTRLLLQRVLKPGDTFVDVGCHIGMHTLAAAQILRGNGRIFSFEPSAKNHLFLQKSLILNGCQGIVTTFNCAVSNQAGEQPLYLGKISTHQSLFPLSPDEAKGDEFEVVKTIRLDEAVPPDEKVRLIKIDAEGAELQVLEGAKSIVQKNPGIALIVEFGACHLRRLGVEPSDWLRPFADLGLVYRVVDEKSGKLEEWDFDRLTAVDSVNLFFAYPESDVWAVANA
ncbi:FkbM family methyltransferase [Blastopirellula marina]|uniref:FkbM family methyltransferase n=1 Tax=Blastopirellula marina TaxID=124 RepID=UPI001376349C|nr:FkbM family methyltransferase [Blastopirellula marina]